MSIIRTNKTEKYFVASNELFNDKLLSWDARGLMAYLLSKPNHWQVRISDLVAQSPAGITKLRSVLAELHANGYIRRTRIKNEDGTFDWVTDIYESSIGRFSVDGKPADIVSTDVVSTDNNMASGENQPSAEPCTHLPADFDYKCNGCGKTIKTGIVNLPIEWQIAAGKKDLVMPDNNEQAYIDSANLIAMGFGVYEHAAYGIAYTFQRTRGIIIPTGKVKGQRKAVKEMLEMGVLPNHVQEATTQLMDAKMTVTDLYSIAKTAIALANPAPENYDGAIEGV